MRISKLVQSTKSNVFAEIKNELDENKIILFSGTPCEVAGLKMLLNKEYENLYTCDLICGCVASHKVYNRYIDFLENKFNSRVTSVNFKDKSQGWHNLRVSIGFENGEVYSDGIYDDPYIVSFHSRFNIRTSCFNCKFRGLNSASDLTLGDFWGINYINPELDDNKGTSFIMVNSSKGEQLISNISDLLKNEVIDINIDDYGGKYNVCLTKSPVASSDKDRYEFYSDLNNNMSFDLLFEKHLEKIREERRLRRIEYFKKLNEGK